MNCRDATGAWGVLIFMRGDDVPDFRPAEVALLNNLSGRVAEGLRRATVVGRVTGGPPTGPGLLLLSAGDRLTVDHVTPTARQ